MENDYTFIALVMRSTWTPFEPSSKIVIDLPFLSFPSSATIENTNGFPVFRWLNSDPNPNCCTKHTAWQADQPVCLALAMHWSNALSVLRATHAARRYGKLSSRIGQTAVRSSLIVVNRLDSVSWHCCFRCDSYVFCFHFFSSQQSQSPICAGYPISNWRDKSTESFRRMFQR